MSKVLLAGESWENLTIHIKGLDSFFTTKYGEGAKWLVQALNLGGISVEFIPTHHVASLFPTSLTELNEYDVVILSDVGSNNLLMHPDTFEKSIPTPNRLKLLKQYVAQGGSLLMIGGYVSFQGIEGKARYKDTPIEEILPINMLSIDDRCEVPEGFIAQVINPQHPVVRGIDTSWPVLLGYNKVVAKEGSTILVSTGSDPLLVIGNYGDGKTAAFTSDCAPHWGSPDFLNWKHYNTLWQQLIEWLVN